jgi:Asp/Glu/hydantoin racemase
MKNGRKFVVVIHTSFVSVDHLRSLFNEIIPEAITHHIVDDSLLADVMAAGGLTPLVTRRICSYACLAEAMGADLIFNQCSSVGEAVNTARGMISIPFIKVDEPMAAEAARIGRRVSVVATVASTVGPSVRLVQEVAARAGAAVSVRPVLVEGALDILMKEGNREKHNKLVLEAIHRVEGVSDVIVLAQGSMVVLEPLLGATRVPVLTSPRLGVQKVRAVLGYQELV